MRNPTWQRDELILALDLYFSEPYNSLSAKHSKVQQLSTLLNKLNILDTRSRTNTFRNPDGVYMKLGNFLAIDPTDARRGLPRFGVLDKMVFYEYFERQRELAKIADLIKKAVVDEVLGAQLTSNYDDANEDMTVSEGRIVLRLHRFRERDRKIVERKKSTILKRDGKLECEVCGFDFEDKYGRIGKGFAECHHVKPVGLMEIDDVTTVRDLAIVCANCHRMLHRNLQLSIEQLRERIR